MTDLGYELAQQISELAISIANMEVETREKFN